MTSSFESSTLESYIRYLQLMPSAQSQGETKHRSEQHLQCDGKRTMCLDEFICYYPLLCLVQGNRYQVPGRLPGTTNRYVDFLGDRSTGLEKKRVFLSCRCSRTHSHLLIYRYTGTLFIFTSSCMKIIYHHNFITSPIQCIALIAI